MRAIAIDGPSGAGKSTISRALAKALGYIYVDTGALYRVIGLHVLECGADPKDAAQVGPLLRGLEVDIRFSDGEQRVFLNGADISGRIRTPDVSMAASDVSAHTAVRSHLLELQRSLARENNVIMDGRDIGTVVLPDADIKIFLTATPEDRAMRRYEELTQKGVEVSYESVLADQRARDHNDSTRAESPLRPADDAIIVDTTGFMLERSIKTLLAVITER